MRRVHPQDTPVPRDLASGDALRRPGLPGAVPERDAVEREDAPDRLEELVDGGRPGEARERLRVRARTPALRRPPRRERDEPAHRARDEQEDGEREQVLGLTDRERVERRREVPVREQKGHDGGAQRRPDAADRGDGDDRQEVEQQDAREAQVVAQVREDDRERGEEDGRQDGPGGDPASRQRVGPTPPSRRHGAALAADHVDVDVVAGGANHGVDHGAAGELPPARASRRAEHDLGRVDAARRDDERLRDLLALDLAEAAAETLHERPLTVERAGGAGGEAVLRADVHGDQVALHALGHAPRTPYEAIVVLGAREGDDDALARLPRPLDPLIPSIRVERLLDAVGHPEERELSEGPEVPDAEVVAERRVDPLGRIDVAVGHPPPERLGAHVDELDLIGPPNDLVGDRLALRDPGDPLDHVVERLEVLDVERRDHGDPGVEQLVHVLPALLVPGSGHVRVRQLVDERDPRPACEDRVDVHLLERRAAVVDRAARDDLEVADLRGGLLSPVRLDDADDDVGAAVPAAAALVEHRERLADARRRAEVDPKRPAGHGPS